MKKKILVAFCVLASTITSTVLAAPTLPQRIMPGVQPSANVPTLISASQAMVRPGTVISITVQNPPTANQKVDWLLFAGKDSQGGNIIYPCAQLKYTPTNQGAIFDIQIPAIPGLIQTVAASIYFRNILANQQSNALTVNYNPTPQPAASQLSTGFTPGRATGAATTSPRYTVSGKVLTVNARDGIRVASGIVTLLNNGSDEITVKALSATESPFTFPTPLSSGSAYNVVLKNRFNPGGLVCNVSSGGSGTISNRNVDNVVIFCIQPICKDVASPGPEVCNGYDDDCDGVIDNNPVDVGGACGTNGGIWICESGQRKCNK